MSTSLRSLFALLHVYPALPSLCICSSNARNCASCHARLRCNEHTCCSIDLSESSFSSPHSPKRGKSYTLACGFLKKFLPLERGRHHHHIAQKGLHGVRFRDRLYHKKVHCHKVYSYRRKSHHIVLVHGLVVISTSFLEGPLQYVRKRVNEGLVNSLRTATRSVLSLRRRDGVSDEGASTPRNHVILAVKPSRGLVLAIDAGQRRLP